MRVCQKKKKINDECMFSRVMNERCIYIAGLSKSRMGWKIVIAVIIVRYVILPAVGIGVVKAASNLGFLPSHLPLYQFVLMIQFTLPPSMNIGSSLSH